MSHFSPSCSATSPPDPPDESGGAARARRAAATTSIQTTSVGTAAIDRFLRPVTYQDAPDDVLPPPLQEDNPWQLTRRVDGILQQV